MCLRHETEQLRVRFPLSDQIPLSFSASCRLSDRAMARTGLRMMPTFPSSPLKFHTVSFPALRLQGWLIERCLPSVRRPIVTPVWFASLLRDPRFQPGHLCSMSKQLCAGSPPFEQLYCPTPGALAPVRVLLSRSINT